MNRNEAFEHFKAKYERLMITQHEAMGELDIGLNSIIRLRKSGALKSKMVGGKAMINIGDLAEYMCATH